MIAFVIYMCINSCATAKNSETKMYICRYQKPTRFIFQCLQNHFNLKKHENRLAYMRNLHYSGHIYIFFLKQTLDIYAYTFIHLIDKHMPGPKRGILGGQKFKTLIIYRLQSTLKINKLIIGFSK